MDFLEENAKEDKVVIYASAGYESILPASLFVYSILVPQTSVAPPDVDDLLRWDINREAGWGVREQGEILGIESSLRGNHSRSLAWGEHLLFTRSFEGVRELDYYMEVSQKFSHVCGIHHMPERKAWCRLNRHGDIEEAVREVEIAPSRECGCSGRIVFFSRDVLEKYAALTETVLVRMFDFDRLRTLKVADWKEQEEKSDCLKNIFYRYGLDPGNCSYTRGVQIIPVAISKEEVARRIYGDLNEDDQEQGKFIVARDFENEKIEEVSHESGMRVAIAFFRPEVLSRYKADHEKYHFTDDSIRCRDSWVLEFFDINEDGQVYAFLKHLSYLPREEQLYWKRFNERPKAIISRHVFERFFVGRPYSYYNPLASLKNKLRNLKCDWWKMRTPDAINRGPSTR